MELKLSCDNDAFNLGMLDKDFNLYQYNNTSNFPNMDGLVISADGRGLMRFLCIFVASLTLASLIFVKRQW